MRDQANSTLTGAADTGTRDQDVALVDGSARKASVGALITPLDRHIIVARRHKLARLVILVGQAGAFALAARGPHVIADNQAVPTNQLADWPQLKALSHLL